MIFELHFVHIDRVFPGPVANYFVFFVDATADGDSFTEEDLMREEVVEDFFGNCTLSRPVKLLVWNIIFNQTILKKQYFES